MLSKCLKFAFEEYLKVKLLQKEIDTTQQELDKDQNNEESKKHLELLKKRKEETESYSILGEIKSDEE